MTGGRVVTPACGLLRLVHVHQRAAAFHVVEFLGPQPRVLRGL